jgi:hypothetical protein
VIFRRRRFAEAIERQLDLFERENSDLLRRCEQAQRDYDAAERDEAQEVWAAYLDLVEIATDELEEMRDAFAATLDESAANEYEAAFDGAVRKRFAVLRAAG